MASFQISRHRLTLNLRNTARINQWLKELIPDLTLRERLVQGPEVMLRTWKTEAEEGKMVKAEIQRLVSQGVKPQRITILSTHRQENSSLASLDRIKEWQLDTGGNPRSANLKFSTIRKYKGLESDIVFLIGITPDSKVSTLADIYVGSSRARFLLYVFHRDDWDVRGDGEIS